MPSFLHPTSNSTTIRAVARSLTRAFLEDNPDATMTEMAEYAALSCSHPEWLDDPEHFIWDLALEVKESFL